MFNDPFCSQISSGTLIADRVNNKLLLGTPQQLGRASLHFSDETFAHVCVTVGQIRWLNVCDVLLSRESQITLVVFSLR